MQTQQQQPKQQEWDQLSSVAGTTSELSEGADLGPAFEAQPPQLRRAGVNLAQTSGVAAPSPSEVLPTEIRAEMVAPPASEVLPTEIPSEIVAPSEVLPTEIPSRQRSCQLRFRVRWWPH